MNLNIKERVIQEALYIIKTKKTVREISKVFKISKSTVHKDLHERLLKIDSKLYNEVDDIFKYHTNIRHILGGQSTKNKYSKKIKE